MISISEKQTQSQNESQEMTPEKRVWKHFRINVCIDGDKYSCYADVEIPERYADNPDLKKEAYSNFIRALHNGGIFEFFKPFQTRKNGFPLLINLNLVKYIEIELFAETDSEYNIIEGGELKFE